MFDLYPSNISLYKVAITHKSVLNTHHPVIHNERLEFLGDAVLDLVVADFLYEEYQDKSEGFLTKMRAKIVSRSTLNQLSIDIGIPSLLVLHTNPNHQIKHIYGDALEALIGAIYLDKGYAYTKKMLIKFIRNHIDFSRLEYTETDFKSRLIEWGQKNKKEFSFEFHESFIEDAKTITFTANILLGSLVVGKGVGQSKKEAEQKAACKALSTIAEHLSLNLN
ncbi:ribonuclease III [uncultured Acetobacteroides sp.]|uniref:ribonuclease III n=1 Tax=uncultured Acetobacteroides sp. TaxID=1760811 RepID=UPI0029F4D4FA|nr:ribonuclease III [uncultured Acetobacteroides sp.]